MKNNTIVFGIQSYLDMSKEIAKLGKWQHGEIEIKRFPDGERYQRIITNVTNKRVILVAGLVSDSDTLEMFDLACSISKYGASHLDIVIPYFSYSTMERSVKSGEVVTAKTRSLLLSKIPTAAQGNKVYFLDLHSEGIQHYLEGGITSVHVYGKKFVMDAVKQLTSGKDFVLASTDAGRAKWVQSLANDFGVQPSFVFKKRISGDKTEISAVSAHVQDKHVIIYDDMIRTGGSLLNAAKAYKDCGAKKIDVITTHGILPNDSLNKICGSGLIRSIHCTNSHYNVNKYKTAFLKIHSISNLFVEVLK